MTPLHAAVLPTQEGQGALGLGGPALAAGQQPDTPLDLSHQRDPQPIELELDATLVLRPGTKLFHGTLEPLVGDRMLAGGYDGCFWLTDCATVARTYIPVAGSQALTCLKHLMEPPPLHSLAAHYQKQLGIEFRDIDYKGGVRAQSYYLPKLFDQLMADTPHPKREDYPDWDPYFKDKFAWDAEQERRVEAYLRKRLVELGYPAPKSRDESFWLMTTMQNGEDHILRNEHQEGTLLEFTPARELRIFDMTEGGAIEGDLTDKQYHETDAFRRLAEQGYDGVRINDFCQSKQEGNVGHTSIGIFPKSISALAELSRQASTHPHDFWSELRAERALQEQE